MYTTIKLKEFAKYAYILLLVVHPIMLFALAADAYQVERICSYLYIILGMVILATSFFSRKTITISDLLLLFFFLYVSILGIMQSWAYDNWIASLSFLLMLTVWKGSYGITISQLSFNPILVSYLMQGLLLMILSFSTYAFQSYQAYVPVSNELTLGFSNPNQTGIILLSTVFILVLLYAHGINNRYLSVFVIIECVGLAVLLLLTHARTSIIACAFWLVIALQKKTSLYRRVFVPVSYTLMCLPLLFVFTYIGLSKTLLSSSSFLGKPLFSGREEIYSNVLGQWSNILFGNLKTFNFENLHNSHLTILVCLGIVGFLLYYIFTSLSLRKCMQAKKSNLAYLCGYAVLSFFLVGCFESAVLTGGTIYYFYFLTIIVLLHSFE